MTYLTVEDVESMIDEIANAAADPEHAHGLEDNYTMEVLADIAARDCQCGCVEVAATMLESYELDFSRWYS